MHTVCIAVHVVEFRFALHPEGARHPFCVEASTATACGVGLSGALGAEVVVMLFAAVGVAEGFGGFLDLGDFLSILNWLERSLWF